MICSQAFAAEPGAASYTVQERMLHRRAVEAMIWSMPLVNYMAMREGLQRDAGVEIHDVAYMSKPATAELGVTTPNDTTPYMFVFWNLRNGPMVVEVPPASEVSGLYGTLMDAWQRPLLDYGEWGIDQGRGGKFLLLPPDYKGDYPPGFVPLPQKTWNGYTLIRNLVKGGDYEAGSAYAKTLRIYPLSKADNPPTNRYVDIAGREIDAVTHFDVDHFRMLHRLLQEETVEERDRTMMGLLHQIGLRKGEPFEPTEREISILNAAGKETQAYLIDSYHNDDRLRGFFGNDRQWSAIVPDNFPHTGATWDLPGHVDIDGRAITYYVLFTSIKNFNLFNPETMYLKANKDADGDQLKGGENYKLTVPADVPAKRFWSALAYKLDDATWFKDVTKYGVASGHEGIKINEDGTVDVYFGPKSPEGKEANWVPTIPGKDYFLWFRFYQPTAPLFKKEWVLNDLVKGW
jgi:hypothetical protein